jgi:hypothetical protein
VQTSPLPQLTAGGYPLDMSRECFGELRNSIEIVDDPAILRARMEEDGYLYLPGYLDREEVLEVRRVITNRLSEQGLLDPSYPAMGAVAAEGASIASINQGLVKGNQPLHRLLYSGRMMDFYTRFIGGEVRHFDYTWMRAIGPGRGTPPHFDIVFMGRGTKKLYTAWTPLGDIPYEVGGLMILEDSHKHERLCKSYGAKDVDRWCTNRREAAPTGLGGGGNIADGGSLSKNPIRLRERLGGRWLTTEFRAGDLLTFSMFTAHASVDNASNRIRLSCDSRYQLASEPVDERWVGENPIMHGPDAKRGMIC